MTTILTILIVMGGIFVAGLRPRRRTISPAEMQTRYLPRSSAPPRQGRTQVPSKEHTMVSLMPAGPTPAQQKHDYDAAMQRKAERWLTLHRIADEALTPEERAEREQLEAELDEAHREAAPWAVWALERADKILFTTTDGDPTP